MTIGGKKEMRMNEFIRNVSEVRLLGEEGEALGVVRFLDALAKARASEMDLVEISPSATPPVCRIMDYGKFKYQQTKKEHDVRRKQQQVEIKGLRIKSYKIGGNDLRIKLRQARQFIEANHRLLVTLMFKAREHGHADLGEKLLLEQIGKGLADIAKIESMPRKDGRRMTMSLAPLPNLKQILAQRAKEEEAKKSREPAEGADPAEERDEPALLPEDESETDDGDDGADEEDDGDGDDDGGEPMPK